MAPRAPPRGVRHSSFLPMGDAPEDDPPIDNLSNLPNRQSPKIDSLPTLPSASPPSSTTHLRRHLALFPASSRPTPDPPRCGEREATDQRAVLSGELGSRLGKSLQSRRRACASPAAFRKFDLRALFAVRIFVLGVLFSKNGVRIRSLLPRIPGTLRTRGEQNLQAFPKSDPGPDSCDVRRAV